MSFYYKYCKYKQKYNNLLGGSEEVCDCGGNMFCEICAQQNEFLQCGEDYHSESPSETTSYPTSNYRREDAHTSHTSHTSHISQDNNIKCCYSGFYENQVGALCALHACNNLLQKTDPDGLDILKHFCKEELKVATDKSRNCTGNFIDTVVYQYLIRRSELCKTGDGKDFDVHPDIQPFFKYNTHKTATVFEDNKELIEQLMAMGYTQSDIEYGIPRSQTLSGFIKTIETKPQTYDVAVDVDVDDEYAPIWKLGYFEAVDEDKLLDELNSELVLPEGRSLLGYIIKVPGHYIAIRVSKLEEDCKKYCFIDSVDNYIINGDAAQMIYALKTLKDHQCWRDSPFETKPMVIKVLSVD